MAKIMSALRIAPGPSQNTLRDTVRDFFAKFHQAIVNPYRPERHYMRGPGPACRAKQERLQAEQTAAATANKP